MIKKLLLLTLGLTSIFNTAHATHVPGANITYVCDPSNPLTYTFTLTVFRVCPGDFNDPSENLPSEGNLFNMTNTCGLVNPTVPTFLEVGVAEDVNQLCPSATSDCSGGTQPGLWKYTYEATITLPADCDSWTINYQFCCRDQSSNLTGTDQNAMATSTTMNTVTAPCDNSPVVTSAPMPYACAGTTFNYCLSISDPEGDQTTYAMVTPVGGGQSPIAPLPGYTAAAPLTGFVLDTLTGCFSFTEPNIGNYVVAIAINSWNSNGELISTVIHDFQVIVTACTNTAPTIPATVTNVTGGGLLLGPNTVGTCAGESLCFDVVVPDTDAGDIITLQTDGTTLLPGATFVQTGTNPVTGTFCFTVPVGFTSTVVTFLAQDNACPIMGTSSFAVNFSSGTMSADSDPIICGAQTTTLSATGTTNFIWSPAAGLSCTNCPNPIASPTSTTTYTVTGDAVGSCPNTDQVTVTVAPDFTPVVTPASATICENQSVQLNATGPNANAPYTYNWSPASTLNNVSIQNPIAQPSVSTTYTVEMTSTHGCVKTETVDIILSETGPLVLISPSDTLICPGSFVPFTATVTPQCGVSPGCSGSSSTYDIGTPTTLAISQVSPFHGWNNSINWTNKTQYIYTAAELNAQGNFGGTITSLALDFYNATTGNFDDFKIWITCTSQDEFPNNDFIPNTGMTLVYDTNNFTPNLSWTEFDFSTDYDWDGVSNLLIQMCATEDLEDPTSTSTFLVRTSYTNPADRCVYDHSYQSQSCDETGGSRTNSRPNMRFEMCNPVYTYSWSPAGSLTASNIPNPTATPDVATTYTLNVTRGGCTGSAIAQVNIDNSNTVVASNDTIYCVGDPAFNLGAQYMLNGVPADASQGPDCYDQTIHYTTTALAGHGDSTNFNFAGIIPPNVSGGTLTVRALGYMADSFRNWEIKDESSVSLGNIGGSGTNCSTIHQIVIPLSAAQLNLWSTNGSIDFTAVNTYVLNACSGTDFLELRLQMDCVASSGYLWSMGTVSDPLIQNPEVSPAVTTTYVVSSNNGTCPASDTVLVINCLVLPIELVSFSGQNIGEVNELDWSTVTEIDNDYFTIQRSSDGHNFNTIGTVDGAGTSTSELNYRFLDKQPINGMNYYRLRQTDFDGSVSFSDIIAVNTTGLSGIQIYPNPSSHDLFIDINESVSEGMHTIVITDVVGKVMQEQVDFSKNQTTYKISNFNTLVPGIYLIQVVNIDGEIVKIQKIIKQ
ncbi:MAG: hypothetical protein ACJA0U_000033 [Salibacteraceae bacterium]|jgi:hypothetical protein